MKEERREGCGQTPCGAEDTSRSLAVSSSGRSVAYMPPGERKSGMPAAPVRNATLVHFRLRMYAAMPRVSGAYTRPLFSST